MTYDKYLQRRLRYGGNEAALAAAESISDVSADSRELTRRLVGPLSFTFESPGIGTSPGFELSSEVFPAGTIVERVWVESDVFFVGGGGLREIEINIAEDGDEANSYDDLLYYDIASQQQGDRIRGSINEATDSWVSPVRVLVDFKLYVVMYFNTALTAGSANVYMLYSTPVE